MCRLQNLNVRCIAIINDNVGALMTGAHSDPKCRVGLIIGKFTVHSLSVAFVGHTGITERSPWSKETYRWSTSNRQRIMCCGHQGCMC